MKQTTVRQSIRVLLLGIIAALLFVAVGLGYRNLVEPQQAVWDVEEPVHWAPEVLPLTVYSEEYPEALREAVRQWNDQAGIDLFVLSKTDPRIEVTQGSIEVGGESEDWGASAYVLKDSDGGPVRGKIVVHVPLMVGTDLNALHHELGHILGLAHDKSGTMKPLIKEELGGGVKIPRAQDKDIRAIQKRYR